MSKSSGFGFPLGLVGDLLDLRTEGSVFEYFRDYFFIYLLIFCFNPYYYLYFLIVLQYLLSNSAYTTNKFREKKYKILLSELLNITLFSLKDFEGI